MGTLTFCRTRTKIVPFTYPAQMVSAQHSHRGYFQNILPPLYKLDEVGGTNYRCDMHVSLATVWFASLMATSPSNSQWPLDPCLFGVARAQFDTHLEALYSNKQRRLTQRQGGR